MVHRKQRTASRRIPGPSHLRVLLFILAIVFAFTSPASAHVGNKDVYQTVTAGPYKLFVTIRTPTVIPGVATIEVRSAGAPISGISVTPLPLAGEASKHPPTSDPMQASAADPSFFTGSLWIMATGSWQVRLTVDGPAGHEIAGVPVPASSTQILTMQRPMGMLLGALGLLLMLGIVGIVAAATREARLEPGVQPDAPRQRRALFAGAGALVFAIGAVLLGGWWWNVEAADYSLHMHRNSEMRPTLTGNQLSLLLGDPDKEVEGGWKVVKNVQLLPDHGHLMHLYAIRWPEMDAVFHLHPEPTGKRGLAETLPAMPPGTYHLYADVVFAPAAFPETETSMLTIPEGMSSAPLAPEDASATPAPLSAGQLGPSYKLPDGYTMVWDKPATLTANTGTNFVFHLLDPQGKPATDMQLYLGMTGHAAFVKTDGTAFAHTHPEGSAAMPAVMMANQSSMSAEMPDMQGMIMENMPEEVSSTVSFPYGFPSSGRYRLFIQMKHGNTVETGVFDADVQ